MLFARRRGGICEMRGNLSIEAHRGRRGSIATPPERRLRQCGVSAAGAIASSARRRASHELRPKANRQARQGTPKPSGLLFFFTPSPQMGVRAAISLPAPLPGRGAGGQAVTEAGVAGQAVSSSSNAGRASTCTS